MVVARLLAAVDAADLGGEAQQDQGKDDETQVDERHCGPPVTPIQTVWGYVHDAPLRVTCQAA